jgi:hypothetical protein
MWIRLDNAFAPIISAEQFAEALAIVQNRDSHLTNEELLERLRALLSKIGSLSGVLIDEAEEMPSSAIYASRFGGLSRAYALIGYTPLRDFRYIEINRAMRRYYDEQCALIVEELRENGADVKHDPKDGLMQINREFTASLVIARCRETLLGKHRWLIRLENSLNPDITIAARMKPDNETILDYYIFPKIETLAERVRLAGDNGIFLDVFRFDTLEFFLSMARRVSVGEAAA